MDVQISCFTVLKYNVKCLQLNNTIAIKRQRHPILYALKFFNLKLQYFVISFQNYLFDHWMLTSSLTFYRAATSRRSGDMCPLCLPGANASPIINTPAPNHHAGPNWGSVIHLIYLVIHFWVNLWKYFEFTNWKVLT